jgi:hypothetical protein
MQKLLDVKVNILFLFKHPHTPPFFLFFSFFEFDQKCMFADHFQLIMSTILGDALTPSPTL